MGGTWNCDGQKMGMEFGNEVLLWEWVGMETGTISWEWEEFGNGKNNSRTPLLYSWYRIIYGGFAT